MSQFLGLVHYEYSMSTRRAGTWLAFGVVLLLYLTRALLAAQRLAVGTSDALLWEYAGRMAFQLNLFMPVIGGIVAADRMARDVRLGVNELQRSSPLPRWSLVWGKYVGVLLSLLTPQLLVTLLLSGLMVARGTPPALLLYALVAFLAIILPAYAFVTILSLACPLVMPLRVYQVLFTGYWLWGNYLDPRVFPTISDTLLTSCGSYAYEGFFGGIVRRGGLGPQVAGHTPLDAAANLIMIAACIAGTLIALERCLAWRARAA
jgi:hypothetical protein